MNQFKNFVIVIFFLFVANTLFAQDFIYPGIEGRLTEAQAGVIQKADADVKKAEKSIDAAEAIEKKYESLKNSKKEKKRKKYDKKTTEAKKLRIYAEKKYLKAYKSVVGVYTEVITENEYYFSEDEEKNRKLNDDAIALLGEAEDKMKSFDKIKDNKKELKKIRSKNLNTAVSKSRSLKEDALNKQFSALEIILNQDKKKRAEEEDKLAWGNALEANTELAYQDYIDQFPSGKYVSDARRNMSKIKAEEEKQRQMAASQQNLGYTFKVQIAASRFPLSKTKQKRFYSDVSKIEKLKNDGYYKYRVGSFTSYADALTLKNNVLSNAPDAFIVVYNKDGQQIEVTDEMKK